MTEPEAKNLPPPPRPPIRPGNGRSSVEQATRPDNLLARHDQMMRLLGDLAEGFASLGKRDSERVRQFVLRQHTEFVGFVNELIADQSRDLDALRRFVGAPPPARSTDE